MASATPKQLDYIARLLQRYPAESAADIHFFGPGEYGRHLMRELERGTLCVRGASALIDRMRGYAH